MSPFDQTSRVMRHLYQALCLMMLLIAGQQGALVHELGHVSGYQGVDLRADPGDAVDATCALCPSFAQVATPAFSHTFILPLLFRAETLRASEVPIGAAEAAIPTPRSRGPPSLS